MVILRRPSQDDTTPSSALNTGTRRASNITSAGTVRVRADLSPPFAPRPIQLMPRPAPRVRPRHAIEAVEVEAIRPVP
jgi:hypothetical protein